MGSLPTGSYSGGAGGAAGPSTATSNSGFNTSGWNVSFGSGSISTNGNTTMMIMAAVAGVGLLLWLNSRRGRR